MKNVTYYSAGAGSGKTYKLTHLLADKIQGVVRNDKNDIIGTCEPLLPSEVILTTFTNAAASDFRERARAALYEAGLHEKAALLDQALIGTVHSVGEAFIRRYWYLLGVSPEMKVMDEESTNIYISQSLSQLPTPEDIRLFREFQQTFNLSRSDGKGSLPDTMFWKEWLNSIISMGESYRVEDFTHSCEYSLEQIRKYFKPTGTDFNLSRDRFLPLLQFVIDIDSPDERKAALDRCKRAQEFLTNKVWSVSDYAAVGKFFTKDLPKGHMKKCPDIPNAAAELSGIWQSNQVYSLMERLVKRLFELAAQWRKEYKAYKQEMRIIDFNDMEVYMLELLKNPAISEEISGRYKCLMVDEFQDSSPIQVDIFNRLSELISESYWCGDSKQAIYGFRGADTDLTEAVANMIPADNFHTLDTSYRSEPDIVNFCNSVFTRSFEGKLTADKVALKPHRAKTSFGPNLIHWASSVSKKEEFHEQLADYVANFITEYASQEGDSFELKDIAILARTRTGDSSEINQIASALSEKGIPVNVGAGSLLMQKETELIMSILTLVTDPTNQLAKAKIAYLTTPGFELSSLIDSRLESLQADEARKSWLNDNPLVKRILSVRQQWIDQSVSALVESVVVELNLRSILKSWGDSWQQRENNLYQIIDLAANYEEHCEVMTLGATTTGFLDYLRVSEAASAGDNNGVVVSSYHQSKGLQWKNVILVSFDHDFANDKDIVRRHMLGVQKVRTAEPTADNLFPEMIISLIPQVFPTSFGKISAPDEIFRTIVESPEYAKVREATIEECKRLLYVGMTRAQDKLITVTKFPSSRINPVAWLKNIGIEPQLPIADDTEVDLCSTGLMSVIQKLALPEVAEVEVPEGDDAETEEEVVEEVVEVEPIYDLPASDIKDYEAKYVAPSRTGRKDIGTATIVSTSERIQINGSAEIMQSVGTCIHNIYAACNGDEAHDVQLAEDFVRACHFDKVLPSAESVIRARQNLLHFLAQQGEKVAEYHELPFNHLAGEQIVRGSMDLVWETADGCILVDYKTYPGKISDVADPEHAHYAGLYKPQFDCYRSALEAAGKQVLKSFVYYPINGAIVELS